MFLINGRRSLSRLLEFFRLRVIWFSGFYIGFYRLVGKRILYIGIVLYGRVFR